MLGLGLERLVGYRGFHFREIRKVSRLERLYDYTVRVSVTWLE